MKFWHAECVCSLSQKAFTERYRKWCHKAGYYFLESKAEDIYAAACGHIGLLPKNENTKQLVQQTIIQLTSICSSLSVIENNMNPVQTMGFERLNRISQGHKITVKYAFFLTV